MLRSEHIPFNFFAPLKLQKEKQLTKDIFNIYLNETIQKVENIVIEYAPRPKKKYLDDNTSFDAYIEYIHRDGGKGAIGIEVKYTELEYSYGQTEKKRMERPDSIYNVLSVESGLYDLSVLNELRTRKLKQLWRNQLLGEAMLGNLELGLKHFTSVILFPAGNDHFVKASKAYERLLIQERDIKYKALLFEDFIQIGISNTQDKIFLKWFNYLESRYIVKKSSKVRKIKSRAELENSWSRQYSKSLNLSISEQKEVGKLFAQLSLNELTKRLDISKTDEKEILSDMAQRAIEIISVNKMSDDELLDRMAGEIRGIVSLYEKDIK